MPRDEYEVRELRNIAETFDERAEAAEGDYLNRHFAGHYRKIANALKRAADILERSQS